MPELKTTYKWSLSILTQSEQPTVAAEHNITNPPASLGIPEHPTPTRLCVRGLPIDKSYMAEHAETVPLQVPGGLADES